MKVLVPPCSVIIWVLLTGISVLLPSCHRWKYEEVKIHGKVINGTLNVPMAGERVSLYEVKGEFLGPGNGTAIKTVTTNANGEFDFGGVDLRKKDKYGYYVQYVHRGITTNGFCDGFEVKKTALVQDQDIVVFVGAGLHFQMVPDLSVMGVNDSIHIDISTSADFRIFHCNPNAVTDYENLEHISFGKDGFSSNGRGGPFTGGDAYYYIKIRKVKSGVVTITNDTFLIQQQDLEYTINW